VEVWKRFLRFAPPLSLAFTLRVQECVEALGAYWCGCEAALLRNQWAPPEGPDWEGHILRDAKRLAAQLPKLPRISAAYTAAPPGDSGGDSSEPSAQLPSAKLQRSSLVSCGVLGKHAKCSGCQAAFYCCPQHQQAHWAADGHKQECVALQAARNRPLTKSRQEEFAKLRADREVDGSPPPRWDPTTCRSALDPPPRQLTRSDCRGHWTPTAKTPTAGDSPMHANEAAVAALKRAQAAAPASPPSSSSSGSGALSTVTHLLY